MIEQDETSIRVTVVAPVAAHDAFAVLQDPKRHVEIDGSGMLQADVDATPITGTGQVFTMAMRYPSLGDYRTENHVLDFVVDRRITWTTARAGNPPAGVWWTWEFEPLPDGGTRIVHTYDWSRVDDPAVLARVNFPRVSGVDLRQSVRRLVATARS